MNVWQGDLGTICSQLHCCSCNNEMTVDQSVCEVVRGVERGTPAFWNIICSSWVTQDEAFNCLLDETPHCVLGVAVADFCHV